MSLPTRGELFASLTEHLRQAQENMASMAHLHNTEDSHKDKKLAIGWLMMAEMMKKVIHQVTMMAAGRMQ